MRVTFREVLLTLLLASVIFLVGQAMIQSCKVVGSSMEPSLYEGQYLVVNKVVYWFHPPRRGDVIIFHSPENDGHDLIKRVIATPGEYVEIKDGKVYIDGTPLEEPYIAEEPHYDRPPQQVPADCYFVLGDNRNNSSDSHIWGTLPEENVVGKAWLCYWPISKWQVVPNYSFAQD